MNKITRKILNFVLFIVVLILSIVMYSKYLGTRGLMVKEYRVESKILPSNFSGLKIVHFSDLIYKSTISKDDVKKMVDKINVLKPDIVVFTGDLVTNTIKITSEDSTFLIDELSKIKARIGKYAIYGEMDYSYKDFDKVMSKSDFKLLNNESDEIYFNSNTPIYIVGLPSSIKETIDLESSFKFYSEENRPFIIALTHEGNTIKYLDNSTYEVDLILSSHSLNGSVNIPFYGGLFIDENSYKYSKPYYKKGITDIFVSSGLGTRKYAYRLFNKPSFNFYRLKSQS